jgi:predicted nucleic-acid-binding protein
VKDDEQQAKAVYRKFKQTESNREVLFVAAPVFLETIWVLESVYEITRLLKKYIEKLEENQIPNVTSFDSPI